jgi:hypothetical protein
VVSIVEDRVQFAVDGRIEARLAGESTPTGVERLRMGGGLVATMTDRTVAVLDSGVDLDHPDLNVVSGTNCVDPADSTDDDHGHGTTLRARSSREIPVAAWSASSRHAHRCGQGPGLRRTRLRRQVPLDRPGFVGGCC